MKRPVAMALDNSDIDPENMLECLSELEQLEEDYPNAYGSVIFYDNDALREYLEGRIDD